jgi:multiple sugar transport system substrate-binding protein
MFGKGPVNLGYIMDPQIGWDPFRYSHFNSAEWRQQIPGIENYLELELKALESGYPMVKIPGAFEYNDVLDLNVSKYLAGDFPTAKAALDAVAQRWNELNEKFGVDKQKGFYAKMWQ